MNNDAFFKNNVYLCLTEKLCHTESKQNHLKNKKNK